MDAIAKVMYDLLARLGTIGPRHIDGVILKADRNHVVHCGVPRRAARPNATRSVARGVVKVEPLVAARVRWEVRRTNLVVAV